MRRKAWNRYLLSCRTTGRHGAYFRSRRVRPGGWLALLGYWVCGRDRLPARHVGARTNLFTAFHDKDGNLRTRAESQLVQYVGDVAVGGTLADRELLGDLAV